MADQKTKIPPPPWTFAALGDELYHKLAEEYGYGNLRGEDMKFDLDLTPFYQQQASGKPQPENNN